MKNDIEAIRASDLQKLMKVVQMATGMYNRLEHEGHESDEFHELGDALRALGLREVNANGTD